MQGTVLCVILSGYREQPCPLCRKIAAPLPVALTHRTVPCVGLFRKSWQTGDGFVSGSRHRTVPCLAGFRAPKKAFPSRHPKGGQSGRWHPAASGRRMTDEVESRRAPGQHRKTQRPIEGADMIHPNAGRFKRAFVEKTTAPVAPAISRHITGTADRLSALRDFASFEGSPEPFGAYPLSQRLWRCQLPQRGSQGRLRDWPMCR